MSLLDDEIMILDTNSIEMEFAVLFKAFYDAMLNGDLLPDKWKDIEGEVAGIKFKIVAPYTDYVDDALDGLHRVVRYVKSDGIDDGGIYDKIVKLYEGKKLSHHYHLGFEIEGRTIFVNIYDIPIVENVYEWVVRWKMDLDRIGDMVVTQFGPVRGLSHIFRKKKYEKFLNWLKVVGKNRLFN